MYMIVALVALCTSVMASAIPSHSMSRRLEERVGDALTCDMFIQALANHKKCSLPKWVDNDTLTFSCDGVIELLNIETGSHISLGNGKFPTPSPDGSLLAFMHENQLWIMQRDGSKKKPLTDISEGILGSVGYHYEFAWSPDSTTIALVYQPEIIPGSIYQDRDEHKIKDEFATSAFDVEERVSHPIKTHLLLIDVISGNAKNITTFDAAIRDLSWIEYGKKLLFTTEIIDVKKFQDMVQTLSLGDGVVTTLAAFDYMQQFLSPVASPDSKCVAIAADLDTVGDAMCSIVCIDGNQNVKRLTSEMKMASPQWSRDGSMIYALRTYGAYTQLYAIDVASGSFQQCTNAPQSIQGFRLSPDGSKLVLLTLDAHDTCKILLASQDGQNVRDLIVIESAPQNIALSSVEEVEWDVPNYPNAMRGLLLLPHNYTDGMRYPLIIDIHGGGPGATIYLSGGILVKSPLEWQLWTANGYAVFVPEFRSSASFGSLAITRDLFQKNDILHQDINDINAGVDALIARGIIDENRMAVIGHSAGARRANWLTVTTSRYRAVVSHDGWADEWLESGLQLSSIYTHPVFDPEYYQKNSSIFHAKGATTPTLFLMGNPRLGGVDPHETVLWLYHALKAQGVTAKYFMYPDEGHCFIKPANQLHALQQMLRWVDEYTLKAK